MDSRRSPVPFPAISLILTGIALATVGTSSLHGLLRGLFLGAGVAMILIGVAVLSAHHRPNACV